MLKDKLWQGKITLNFSEIIVDLFGLEFWDGNFSILQKLTLFSKIIKKN